MNSPSAYYQQHRSEILELINVTPKRILDIGCAKGGVARMLRNNYHALEIVGFDKYKDESFNYTEIFESFHNFDLSDIWPNIDYSTFDVVLLLDVLEHLIDPESVLKKLSKLIPKKTQVIISLPNFSYYSNLYEIIRKGRFEYKDSGILDRTHLHFYGQADARDLIEKYFSINAYMPHHLKPRSRLNKLINITLGDKYSAYQNIFRCSALGA